jgi:hypothetical protein
MAAKKPTLASQTPASRIAQIKLDRTTRARIAKELGGVPVANVPDRISVTRVPHAAVGVDPKLTKPHSWVLVMD